MFVSIRLRDDVPIGAMRPMDAVEIAARAHFLVDADPFVNGLVGKVRRKEQVVDAHLGLAGHGPGAPARDDNHD